MAESKSNAIWWIAGGAVVAYLLYNHGTTGTTDTVTTGDGSNIGLPQTKRVVGGFVTRPNVGMAQTNLSNTVATGAISTTTTQQTSILQGILNGLNKLATSSSAAKSPGISLGGGGGGGNNAPVKSENAASTASTASTALSTPSVYNGSAPTISGVFSDTTGTAGSGTSLNSLVDPSQSAYS